MPWFWTDDLADLLIANDGVDPDAVAEWRQRPVALAIPEGIDPIDYVRRILGIEQDAVA